MQFFNPLLKKACLLYVQKKKERQENCFFWGGNVNKFAHNGKLIAIVTV